MKLKLKHRKKYRKILIKIILVFISDNQEEIKLDYM